MAVPADEQISVWLQDYCLARRSPLGGQKPPYSLCYGVLRKLFEAGFGLDDLEAILQGMMAEKVAAKSYAYIATVIKNQIDDLERDRKLGVIE
jgi:hypothetical protein